MTVDAVILAAGTSSRAGGFKPSFPIDGTPMILRIVRIYKPFCARVIVVGGYRIDTLRELLCEEESVTIVENGRYERGMFSSIKQGLKAVTANRAIVTPGDLPFVKPSTIECILSRTEPVAVPGFENRRGHPVLLSKETIGTILGESDESNLREVLSRQSFITVETDDPGILHDIDYPADIDFPTPSRVPIHGNPG
ncbi:MAG: nucleotidyltransferase family protein [Rhodopseudomonas palustris]|nr:nucleotidyltransferase family protein [Rhodopseudomonas palustris]